MGAFSEEDFSCGSLAKTSETLELRIRKITTNVSSFAMFQGFVWTLLTDVQQEINGLARFNQQPKFLVAVLIDIFGGGGEARC